MGQVRVTEREYRKLLGRPGNEAGPEPQAHTARPAKRQKQPRPKLADSFRVVTDPVRVVFRFPPSLNRYWRHAVISGHAVVYMSREGKEFRHHVIEEWGRQAGRVTFQGRLAVRITAIYPDRRGYDLDGLIKATLDAMEHAGAYADDEQVKLLVVENELVEKPGRIEIVVGPKPGVDQQKNLFACGW